MSALLTASCAAASALPALLAAVNLSISKPSEYHFVTIPDEMMNSLEGVGLKENDEGEHPLRYEDAAFLTEAYAERYGMMDRGATNGSKSVGAKLVHPYDYYALAFVGGTNAVTVIEPYGYAVTNGTLLADIAAYNAANSYYAYDALIPILGAGCSPYLKPSIDLTSADWTNKVLSAKNVAALYADLGRFSRAYETCSVLPASGTSNEYITVWSEDYSNMGVWKNTYINPDGWGYGEAKNGDSVSYDAKAYDFRYSRTFKAKKKKARGWGYEEGDKESKWVDETGAVLFTATETSESYSRVQGAITSSRFKTCGDRKYGSASLYAYGTVSCERTYTSSSYSTGFVIRLGSLGFNDGKAETDFALAYSDVTSIADKALALVQHQVVFQSAEDLLNVLPDPETPSSDYSNYSDTYTEDTFKASVLISKFFAVVDGIEFNARVKGDGE